VEEFLQALPAITHELSEALTAVSTYLAGSRHLFEHGTRFDKIQSAIELADLQARRANDTVRLLRESFGKLGLAEKLTNQARAKNAGIESRMRWARRVRGKLSWAGDRHRRYSDALAARSGAS